MQNYGKSVTGFGKIPTGSDQDTLWYVFTSGDKPVHIVNGAMWGGDAGEWISIYLLPAGSQKGGSNTAANVGGDPRNAINVYDQLKGLSNTEANKRSIFGQYGGGMNGIYVPPNHALAISSTTPNAVAWKMILQGFELE
jgi:hypothetical protein